MNEKTTVLLGILGALLLGVIANIIFVVLAFMAVNNGTEFKAPAFNFIK